MNRIIVLPALLWAMLVSNPCLASEEVDVLRHELNTLRIEYEARLKKLEERLQQAEAASRESKTPEQEPARSAAAAPVGDSRGGVAVNAFNPAISAVVQGKVASQSLSSESAVMPGFPQGGEAGSVQEGFSLDETEITLSANVDPRFYGEITLGFHEDEGDTEVDIEEAFFDTTSLPHGLALRGGRFYSNLGYLNRFHTHAWSFSDAPLVHEAFLGGQYKDDGVRLSWLAPTDLYVNLGMELLQGSHYPGAGSDADLGDSRTLFMHLGGDLGVSHSWRLGLSGSWQDPEGRASNGHAHEDSAEGSRFSGRSDLLVADLVWKWAPQGNFRQRNFTFVSEYFQRKENGDVQFSEAGDVADLFYQGKQWGWYAQGVYQFMPHWRVGLRYDQLHADNHLMVVADGGLDADEVLEESGYLSADYKPQRWSLMADYSPSEFSRIRLQYNRDERRLQGVDHQWLLQFIMSLGAHGAHEF